MLHSISEALAQERIQKLQQDAQRERVAAQVHAIRRWRRLERTAASAAQQASERLSLSS
jgi:hypothetical protein